MNRLPWTLCVCLTALLFVGYAQEGAPNGSIYRDAASGISIVPPAFDPNPTSPITQLVAFAAPAEGNFAANMNLQKQPMIKSLAQFVQISDAQFRQMGFNVLEKQDKQVGGRPAVEYVYEGQFQGMTLKSRSLAVECEGYVLLATCLATKDSFERYDPKFRESLATLAIKE